jgi:hypothetical protein
MTGPPLKNSPFLSDTPQMNADQAVRSLGSVRLAQTTITEQLYLGRIAPCNSEYDSISSSEFQIACNLSTGWIHSNEGEHQAKLF